MLTAFVKVLLLLACVSINGIASEQFGQEFVNNLNAVRAVIAQSEGYANMHALSWDEEYEKLLAADKELSTCTVDEKDTRKPPARPVLLLSNIKDEEAKRWMKTFRSGKPISLMNLELIYSPIHTRVGCVKANCQMKMNDRTYGIKGVCLLGPKVELSITQFKLGKAGSECGSAQQVSGLCVESGQKLEKGDSAKGMELGGSQGAVDVIGKEIKEEKTTSATAELRIALSFIFFVLLAY